MLSLLTSEYIVRGTVTRPLDLIRQGNVTDLSFILKSTWSAHQRSAATLSANMQTQLTSTVNIVT